MRIRKLRCSFCRKTEHRVSKLVAGPGSIFGPKLYICDECGAVANSIMPGNFPPTSAVSRLFLERMKEPWRCLLHRKLSREASVA